MKTSSLPLRLIVTSLLCVMSTAALASPPQEPGGAYKHCPLHSASLCENDGADKNKEAITDEQWTAEAWPTWSAQAGSMNSKVAIDLFNTCRWIDKSDKNTDSKDIFVPFKTQNEWEAFVTNAPSDYVTLTRCARPGKVTIPANDTGTPASDGAILCYDNAAKLQTATLPYNMAKYGRADKEVTVTPEGMGFQCYTKDGMGPLAKTVTAIKLMGYDADRKAAKSPDGRDGTSSNRANNNDWGLVSVEYKATSGLCGTAHGQVLNAAPSGTALCNSGIASAVGGTGPWTWVCRGLGNTASCQANKPLNGSCGAANGTSRTSAPSGNELCRVGTPTSVSGQWSWKCQGTYGGTTSSCSASYSPPPPPTCPFVAAYGNPLNNGTMSICPTGYGCFGVSAGDRPHSNGGVIQYTHWPSIGCNYFWYWSVDGLVQCIATNSVRNYIFGGNMQGSCSVGGFYMSPVKVNLAGRDATMNSKNPTSFYLTLLDERILQGKATGGLNPDEGWLMVRRSDTPLVFDDGALNGDNWFGDRDKRTANGYTDLAETFKDFIETDENGQRFIPLHVLTQEERKAKTERLAGMVGTITDPSYDLRVIDAKNVEHFASDYFSRIYVDFRMVSEGDGPDGKPVNNVVLERSTVRTINGENTASVDQWFILDIREGFQPTSQPTKSKVLPAKTPLPNRQ